MRHIVSVGGSLMVPDTPDPAFLRALAEVIRAEVSAGHRFLLVAGGGRTARNYQSAATQVAPVAEDDLDWLGIHATRLNAHLLRTVLRDLAHPRVLTDPTEAVPDRAPVVVAGGWRPGWSTDYVMTVFAERNGWRSLVNLSNVDYLYDRDPRTDPEARPYRELDWDAVQSLVGTQWHPGLNRPFDPVATAVARRLGLCVALIGGRDLAQLRAYLRGEPFVGTLLRPG